VTRIPACFIVEQETGEVIVSQTWVPDEKFIATLKDLQSENPDKTYVTEKGTCDVELINSTIRITFHHSNTTV
jgi:hypothetical protein